MAQLMETSKQKALDFWGKLDNNQKTRLIVTSLLLIVGVTVVLVFAMKTNYVELLTVNNPKDVSAIEKVLTDKKIEFKPGDNGKILVDSRYRNEAKFAISSLPSLSSSVSFDDSWNKIKMSSTESDKKKLWQDFKKNSLIAQLKMFDNVADADVDMAIPEKTVYFGAETQEKTTAYVRIKPRGELSPEQVQGIVNVVSASIEGLDPKDVKVVDSNFNLLTSENSDTDMDRTSTQYKMRIKVKSEMENNVKKLYSGISDNFDAINVVANPILDFNREKSLENDVLKPSDMDEAVVSSNTVKEKLVNGTPGGEPGVNANPGTAPNYSTTQGGNSEYDKTSTTVNRDFRRIQKEYEKALGAINFNNSSLTVTLWYGQRVTDENKLNQQFIDLVKNDVSLATGIPPERISVNKYKLGTVVEEQQKITEVIKELVDSYGLFLLLLLMAVAFIIAIPRSNKKAEFEAELAALAAATGVGSGENIDNTKLDGKSKAEKMIEDIAKKNPEAVAQLLRNWLKDEWE